MRNAIIKTAVISSLIFLSSIKANGEYSFRERRYENSRTKFELIRDNIELFNSKSDSGTKEETHFTSATDYYDVLSPYSDSLIGTLIIFDDNSAYITISNDNHIVDSNYNSGIELLGEYQEQRSIYYLAHTYSFDKNVLLSNRSLGGGSFSDYYHWHANYVWTNEKPRYLLSEFDAPYSTLTNTSNATFKYKTTWSTYQQYDGNCGALALANLLWTYKINNVVDLTNGATNSLNLAATISQSVPNGAAFYEILNINSTVLYGTGYEIDYCDVTNGTSDNLDEAPVIVLHTPEFPAMGHYTLMTGKGESLYQTILWMNIYTSWDVVNTWYDRYSYDNIYQYPNCKYWVDSQYVLYGYVLVDSNGDTVEL